MDTHHQPGAGGQPQQVHLSWRMAVLTPYILFLAMAVIARGIGQHLTFYRKAIEFSVELSILGVGLAAAILASPEARAVLKEKVVGTLVVLTVTTLFISGLLINLKDFGEASERRRAYLMLLFGSVSLAINTSLVLTINRKPRIMIIICTVSSLIVPLILLWLFELVRSLAA